MFRLWALVAAVVCLGVAGCKRTPAYVGTYGKVLTDAEKQRFAPKDEKGSEAEDALKRKMKAFLEGETLTIDADGTYVLHLPDSHPPTKPGEHGADVKGTYTVAGDKLTMVGTGSSSSPQVLTFSEADQTLTGPGQPGRQAVFKKKSAAAPS